MATALAIRDTGETLRAMLEAGAQASGLPVTVAVTTPEAFAGFVNPATPVISIFLHRVTVHPEMRNAPRRKLANGSVTRPLLPLELSFMITPWARSTADEHRLAGVVLQTLYERAELGPGQLQGAAWEPGDSVQLVLESLTSEEHYRVWDTVGLPYRLSLTYLARVVGIEPLEAIPTSPVATVELGSPV
jgi:hypothetical protein